MRRFCWVFLLGVCTLWGAETTQNELRAVELQDHLSRLEQLEQRLGAENIWVKRFYDHRDYLQLKAEKEQVLAEQKRLAGKRDAASRQRHDQLQERSETLQARLELLGEIGTNPYDALTKVDPFGDAPEVRNPFAILSGLSYLREGSRILRDSYTRLDSLRTTLEIQSERRAVMDQAAALYRQMGESNQSKAYADKSKELTPMIASLSNTYEVFSTALSVLEKRFAAQEVQVKNQIKNETVKLVNISVIIGVIIGLTFLAKLIAKRTIDDNNRLFSVNRAANIVAFFIIVLVLLFNYINNILYFVTLLGFISAGIAIAMKDWFMSMLGWLVIVIGGSIHIGDRIRVVRDGDVVVGDVLEIGLTRIMLFEDITLATFDTNRRAGRIIHLPNNYIFTHMIQNYTYDEMKTVWDGIDVVISFDSNHKKALKIAREIAAKHAKGYTDITRKHYNNLRSRYNLRTVSVEPRVYTFAFVYGVKVSIWYLTNSYATLALRSIISAEVIEAFNAADDITIAYPTYVLGSGAHNSEMKVLLPGEGDAGWAGGTFK